MSDKPVGSAWSPRLHIRKDVHGVTREELYIKYRGQWMWVSKLDWEYTPA